MFAYIKGELIAVNTDSIIIENNGIGYNLYMPLSSVTQLPHVGNSVKIHTYFHVKEDIADLFGFVTQDELNIFKLLITVNGIGPKGALSILSALSVDELRFAILSDDSKAISKAQGVGSKTAQRVIIELKDKIDVVSKSTDIVYAGTANIVDDSKNEAVEALIALGYSQSDAYKAVNNISGENLTTEDILKLALKSLI